MFKNGQLVLLPQHMWEESESGRVACRGRERHTSGERMEKERERESEEEIFIKKWPEMIFDPSRGGTMKGDHTLRDQYWQHINFYGSQLSTRSIGSLWRICLDQKQTSPPLRTHRLTQGDKKATRQRRDRNRGGRKRGRRREPKWNSHQTSKRPFIRSV